MLISLAAGAAVTQPSSLRAVIAPMPDRRLGWLRVELETKHGRISSAWTYEGDEVRYEIHTPVPTRIFIDGEESTQFITQP